MKQQSCCDARCYDCWGNLYALKRVTCWVSGINWQKSRVLHEKLKVAGQISHILFCLFCWSFVMALQELINTLCHRLHISIDTFISCFFKRSSLIVAFHLYLRFPSCMFPLRRFGTFIPSEHMMNTNAVLTSFSDVCGHFTVPLSLSLSHSLLHMHARAHTHKHTHTHISPLF